jgi:hypothetical protein
MKNHAHCPGVPAAVHQQWTGNSVLEPVVLIKVDSSRAADFLKLLVVNLTCS